MPISFKLREDWPRILGEITPFGKHDLSPWEIIIHGLCSIQCIFDFNKILFQINNRFISKL